MKKRILRDITIFIVGGLIFGSVGTVLALTYKASDIVYSPNDTSWNVSTVGEAINSLALSKTSDNYSTEEKVVGTWIDGKPIYQKTFNLNQLHINRGGWTTLLTISDADVLVDAVIRGVESGANCKFNVTTVALKNNNLSCWQNIGDGWYATYVTAWYTKTTDSAAN